MTLDDDHRWVLAGIQLPGSGVIHQISISWLIGADGAHSKVCQLTGIPMVGPDNLAEFHSVLFEAPPWMVSSVTSATG